MRKKIIFYLAEKLGVDLEKHFEHKLIPDEKKEFTMMAEEQFSLITVKGIGKFVSEWLEFEDPDQEDVLDFVETVSEEFDIQLEEEYDGDPVENIWETEDEKGKLYLWKVPSEWSEQRRDNLFARLQRSFRKKHGRDPAADHLIIRDLENLKELDRSEMKDLMGHAAKDL